MEKLKIYLSNLTYDTISIATDAFPLNIGCLASYCGKKFEGKLIIHGEQGIGDEILYSTMYSEALKFFPNCKIETEERLLSLFKRSYHNDKIVPFYSISNNKKEIE